MEQLPKLSSNDSKLFRQSLVVASSSQQLLAGALMGNSSSGTKNGGSTSQNMLQDMHNFNKQLSKKTSALKLKQGVQPGASGSG